MLDDWMGPELSPAETRESERHCFSVCFVYIYLGVFWLVLFLVATTAAYGSSQARGRI